MKKGLGKLIQRLYFGVVEIMKLYIKDFGFYRYSDISSFSPLIITIL